MKKTVLVLAILTLVVLVYVASLPHTLRVSSASLSVSYPTVVKLEAYSVVGKPTVSEVFINRVLAAAGSPASGLGSVLYSDGVHFGLDPVFALAFFLHEDDFGKTGWGAVNHSLGNIRCTAGYACQGGYRSYASWSAGFWDWYTLIRVQYVNIWHLVTVEQIVPTYAPSSDGNDVAGYVAAVEAAVNAWRAGRVEVE